MSAFCDCCAFVLYGFSCVAVHFKKTNDRKRKNIKGEKWE